jgi:hypothetical protein
MRINKLTAIGMVLSLFLGLCSSHAKAAIGELAISVVTLTKSAASGEKVMLTIKTEVGAMCLGNKHSESNPNDRGKLGLENVDREGRASWSWSVDRKSTKGQWAVNLQCSTGKKKGRLHETFEVR